MKKSDDYAGNQVRIFLGNLKNGTHPVKVKAIQQFQNYIESYIPNISDDNVDFLFTGNLDGKSTLGLIHFCGIESEKHDGHLKRICAPAINLLHWLVSFNGDEIYFDRFIRLPKDELVKINFPKHILQPANDNKLSLTRSKVKTDDSVFELLSILLHEHRNFDDELEAVDIPYLLGGSKLCQDRLEDWLQKANLEHINQTLELLKAGGQGESHANRKPVYATSWEAVNFKCIPLQEGEEIGSAEIDAGPKEPPPIPDPLGIRDIDLREAQKIFSSGGLQQQSGPAGRRGSISAIPNELTGISARHKAIDHHDDDDDDDEDEDDNDDAHHDHVFLAASRGRRTTQSIIPSDKNFSTSTFLSLVHGRSDFNELKKGLDHLNEQLQQQSRRRENLVRTHFGLFVQCADGLEWLKAYRQGKSNIATSMKNERLITNNGDKGMEQLKKAHITLDLAKVEAKKTLAPILERMKHGREIRSAEKVLRGMSATLEYPFMMKRALERGDLKEVVGLYQRVLSVPGNSSLKIVPKIKKAAEGVVSELKKTCLTQILNPSLNYVDINKHAQLLLELEGPVYYAQVLRQAFVRQLMHLVTLSKEAKLKFMSDIVEAFDRGQELNVLSKNNTAMYNGNGNVEMETITNVVKKFVTASRKRSVSISHDSVKTSKRFSTARTAVLKGGISNLQSMDDDDDGQDEAHEFDDDYADECVLQDSGGIEVWIQSILSQSSKDSPSTRRGSISPFSPMSPDFENMKYRDYSEILCHIVRKSFCEQVVEIVSRSFTCLFRLSCDILVANLAIQSSSSATFPAAIAGNRVLTSQMSTRVGLTSMQSMRGPMVASNPAPFNKPVRTGVSASKLLAISIGLNAEMISQSINGFYPSTNSINLDGTRNSFTIPAELINSFSELDQFSTQLQSQFAGWNIKIDFGDFLTANKGSPPQKPTPSNSSVIRFYELIQSSGGNLSGIASSATVNSANSAFRQSLLQPFHLECLQETYMLYDGLESVMKVAYETLSGKDSSNSESVTSSRKLVAMSFVNGLLPPGRTEKDFIELDFSSSSSPYHDTMVTLSNLAKEGEAQEATKVLEKILDRSCYLSDSYLVDNDGGSSMSARDMATRNSITMGSMGSMKAFNESSGGSRETGVELSVMEFESLVLRGITALKSRLRRPEWSSGVFYEHLIQKILATFIERLRRKALYIEDSKMSTLLPKSEGYIAQSPSDSKRNRKKSVGVRTSMHQNHLILQSLEEELRYCESGWERDNMHFDPTTASKQSFSTSDPKNKAKHVEWIDCIRGYIRLRTCTIPRIMNSAKKVFPMNYSQSIFIPASTNLHGGGLFPEVSSTTSASNTNSGGSLLNRLFAFETTADPATGSAVTTNASTGSGSGVPTAQSPNKALNSTSLSAPSGNNGSSQVLSINLGEKIMSTITQSIANDKINNENLAIQWYFTDTAAGSLLLPMLKDIIAREVENANKYISFRVKSLQSILNGGYAYLVHQELSNQSLSFQGPDSLPVHLSRIILAIHDEKLLLCSTIRNLSIETGGGKEEYGLLTKPSVTGVGKPTDESDGEMEEKEKGDEHNHDEILGVASNDKESGAPISGASTVHSAHATTVMSLQGQQGPRYKHYLYQELCKGCIILYEDLMKRLAAGQYAIPNNANVLIPIKALVQAWEEWEYLKLILRPVLPVLDVQLQQQKTTSISLTQAELQSIVTVINQDKVKNPSAVTKENLLSAGKLLSSMIQ